jgi:DNA-directed RNA polymerase subunit alpha
MASTNLKIEKIEAQDNYAKYEIYPFERGYGNTFATPMRRILYSSIKGTSITTIKVKGVPHEFSTVKGMKEDVLKLISNLRAVIFRLDNSEKENIVLKIKGKKIVKASDIKVPGNVEIANPDLVLAELTTDTAELDLEATIESGFGFELADDEIRNTLPGTIPVPKSFSPVQKVNVNIESTRVAQRTDYEKIVLEIWTNGGLTTDEALKQATALYLERLNELNDIIAGFDGSLKSEQVVEQENEKAK